MNLLVDGRVVRTASGRNNEKLLPRSFRVADLEGKEARLEIVPSVVMRAGARTELTDEAERLVRFMAPEASRHAVKWAGPRLGSA